MYTCDVALCERYENENESKLWYMSGHQWRKHLIFHLEGGYMINNNTLHAVVYLFDIYGKLA